MLLFGITAALATELSTSVDDAGTVQVSTVVAGTESEVRALLSDAEAASRLSPEVLSVQAVGAGRCVTLDVTTRGAWDPLQYRASRCPTASGYRYRLLSSESITDYEAEWSTKPHSSGGTEVTYRLRTEVNLPFPKAMVRKGVIQSAKDTVDALVKRLTRR